MKFNTFSFIPLLFYLLSANVKVLYYRRITSEYFPDYINDKKAFAPSEFLPNTCWIGHWDTSCATDLKFFDGWSNTLNIPFIFQMCGIHKILGGYNNMGKDIVLQKVFKYLPSHLSMEITFELMCIDSWTGETLYISLDDIIIHSSKYDNSAVGTQICGNSFNDNLYTVTASGVHSFTSANIKIWTSLSQNLNQQSFGIKNFKVFLYVDCVIGCLTCSSPDFCTSCPHHAKLVNGICVCKEHHYLEVNTWVHCQSCHIKCKNCISMESNACTECYDGSTLIDGICVLNSNVAEIAYELYDYPPHNAYSWVYSGCELSYQSECGQFTIVGGYKNFGSGCNMYKYFTLPLPHYQFAYHFTLYKIDSWDNEKFFVDVAGVIYTQLSFAYTFDTEYDRNFCGNYYNDHIEDVFQIIPFSFSSSMPKITMFSNLNELADNESWGINNFNLYYFLCDSSCKTCTGKEPTNCKSCYDFATLQISGECKCNPNYSIYIPNVPCTESPCSYCILCSANCIKCSSETNCLLCEKNYALDDKSCANYCSSNKYKDNASVCQACDPTCSTCDKGGIEGCLTCSSDKFLSQTKSCLPCNSNCKTCVMTASTCLSCFLNQYLFDSKCVNNCESGYYVRLFDNTCQSCDRTCLQCSSGGKTGCTKCNEGLYLTNGNCLPCDIMCNTCEINPTQCKSCSSMKYLINFACFSFCPEGNYPKIADNTCQPCDSSCKTCSGPTSSNCNSCLDGNYLTPNYQCQPCDSNCKTCELLISNKCLSCSSPLFLSFTGNKCILSCPEGTFERSQDRTCQQCNSFCKTCSEASSKDCLSCYEGAFLYLTRCLACDLNCKTCINTPKTCKSCTPPLILMNEECLPACLNGYFSDLQSNSCQKCDSNCLTCSKSSRNCETCKANEFKTIMNTCKPCDITCLTCETLKNFCLTCESPLYFQKNECVLVCQPGYYMDSAQKKCQLCDSSCLTCTGPLQNDCQSCVDGKTIASTGECQNCESSCRTCQGLAATNCTSCDASLYFIQNSCKSYCLPGFYPVEKPIKVCLACDSHCYNCLSGTKTDCTKCSDEYYFNVLDSNLKTGECLKVCRRPLVSNPSTRKCEKNCDLKQFLDKTTNICRNCHFLCLSCIGPTENECASCGLASFLFSRTCVQDCPNEYYAEINRRICDACPTHCVKCENATTCLECSSDFYLDVSFKNCTKCENKGTYIDKNERTCNPCVFPCLDCNSAENCVECYKTSALKLNKCIELIYVKPSLTSDEDIAFLYYLKFNNTFPEFFNNMTNKKTLYPKIHLTNLNPNSYSFSVSQSLISVNIFEILVNMKIINDIASEIIVELNPDEEKYCKLTEKNLRLPVPKVLECSTFQFFNKKSMKCQELIIISPLLKKTNLISLIKLEFSDNFPDLFKVITNVSNVSISDMSSLDFTYQLSPTNVSNIFDINLNFTHAVYSKHDLLVNFTLSPSLQTHPRQKLIPENISIEIFENLQQIEFLNQSSTMTKLLFVPLSFITGVTTYGAISFNGVIAIYLIRYLRYIDIDYPDEAMQAFGHDLGYISFLPSIYMRQSSSLDVKQPDRKFKYYNLKCFILENCEGKLVEITGFCVLGVIFKLFYYPMIMKKINKGRLGMVRKVFQRFSLIFYFNLAIIIFILHFMDLVLFSLLNLKWRNLDSDFGVINFSISVGFLFFSTLVLISFTFILLKLRKIFKIIRHHLKHNIPFNSKNMKGFENTESKMFTSSFKIYPNEKRIDQNNKNKKKNKKKNEKWKDENIIEINNLSNFSEESPNSSRLKIMRDNKSEIENHVDQKKKTIKEGANDWRIKYAPYLQYSILWTQFRKRQKRQILFPVVNLVRCFIITFILVILSDFAYICAAMVFGFNSFFFVYAFLAFPFKKIKDWIFQLCLEACVVLASLNALWIANDEYYENGGKVLSPYRGWFILVSNLIAIYVSILCYGIHFTYFIVNFIAKLREIREKKVKSQPEISNSPL